MQITVPCDVFIRLAKVATAFEAERDTKYFNSVYFEAKDGKLIAISTNIKFASIEFLGKTDQADGSFNVACDPALITQCETEKQYKGTMQIVFMEALRYASVKTTFGYNYPGNAAVFTETDNPAFERWRKWLPDKMPSERDSPMFVDAFNLAILAESSPSGAILFPEFTSSVVIVRDAYLDNWIGAFLGAGNAPDGRLLKDIPVKIPDWVR